MPGDRFEGTPAQVAGILLVINSPVTILYHNHRIIILSVFDTWLALITPEGREGWMIGR